MQSSWLAIYSRPNCEKIVAENLRELGKVLYLFVKETRRVKRMHKYRIETVERSFFSRYLFSQAGPYQSPAIKRIEGVCAIVSRRGEPLLVPNRVIDFLEGMADREGCVDSTDFTRPSALFRGKVGDAVRIAWPNHILDGFISRLHSIADLDTKGEVRMFIRFLGSEREVDVPVGFVRLVGAAVG